MNENAPMEIIEVLNAYALIESLEKSKKNVQAVTIRNLVEGSGGVVHLRDSTSEKTHAVQLQFPFTFKDLVNGKLSDKLSKALKSRIEYDGPNNRGYIVEANTISYGHDSPLDLTVGFDILNQIAVLVSTMAPNGQVELDNSVLEECKKNKTQHIRISNRASSVITSSNVPSDAASSTTSEEEEMKTMIAEETRRRGQFELYEKEAIQFRNPNILKLYNAFGGIDRNSLLKGVIAVNTKSPYKFVMETSVLGTAIKCRDNARFVFPGSEFEVGAVHVFRVHKNIIDEMVNRIVEGAKQVEQVARPLEDILCTIRSHDRIFKQKNDIYLVERLMGHLVSQGEGSQVHGRELPNGYKEGFDGNRRYLLNVCVEFSAIYYNIPNCFASDPASVGVWFNPIYSSKDVNTETGTVAQGAMPIYDPSSKTASKMLDVVTGVSDDSATNEAASSAVVSAEDD